MTGGWRLAPARAAFTAGLTLAAGAVAGGTPARKDLFELSSALEARVAAHQDLVNNAGRSAEDFCKLTADTVQILDPVVQELSRFGGSEHQSVPFEAVERAMAAALSALVKAWPAAPVCLRRDALRARLAGELERMATWSCFCAGRDRALSAIRRNAELLKKLIDVRGPELASRWLEVAGAPDARFSCHPG